MSKTLVLLVLMYGVLCYGKHVHPRSVVRAEDEMIQDTMSEPLISDVDGISIDVLRNIKPTRFVPINSVIYFKTYPCEPGFERDLIGVCREVWD